MSLRPLNLSLRMAADGPSYDADALAAFTAIEATGATLTAAQKLAADTFIVGLKAASIWSKFVGLYLFIGGTSGAHAVNWKAPGTYTITWVNSPTHDANGVTGNGSNAYGQTGALASTVCPQNSAHIAVYNRTASPTASGRFIGATSTTGGTRRLDLYNNGGTCSALGINDNSIIGASNLTRLLVASRTASGARNYRRDTSTTNDTTASVGGVGTNLLILARSYEGFANDSFSNANLAFASFGAGLEIAESLTLNTLMTALQTALSRNV